MQKFGALLHIRFQKHIHQLRSETAAEVEVQEIVDGEDSEQKHIPQHLIPFAANQDCARGNDICQQKCDECEEFLKQRKSVVATADNNLQNTWELRIQTEECGEQERGLLRYRQTHRPEYAG